MRVSRQHSSNLTAARPDEPRYHIPLRPAPHHKGYEFRQREKEGGHEPTAAFATRLRSCTSAERSRCKVSSRAPRPLASIERPTKHARTKNAQSHPGKKGKTPSHLTRIMLHPSLVWLSTIYIFSPLARRARYRKDARALNR